MGFTQLNDLVFRGIHVSHLPVGIVHDFGSLVQKWISDSGEEWTVKRLKSFKTDLVRLKAGMPASSSWFRRGKRSHFWGVLGSLERIAQKSDKSFTRVISLVSCYNRYVSKRLTKSQWAKEESAIQAEVFNTVRYIPGTSGLRLPKFDRKDMSWLGEFSPRKRTPHPFEYRFVPQSAALYPFYETSRGRWYASNYFSVARALSEGSRMLGGHTLDLGDYPDTFTAGHILLNQEAGYKLRLAAAPNLVLQLAFVPFKKALYQLLSTIPASAVMDQEKGKLTVQSWIREGSVVGSFDLSSATHLFPLDFQLDVLLDIGSPNDIISLFAELSREPWLMHDGSLLRWSRGQPLGLMPSYGIFHLSHLAAVMQFGISLDNLVILGDDIAVRGDENIERYLHLTEELGLVVSTEKTLISRKAAEFAGSVITQDNIIPTPKWRVGTPWNSLDLIRSLGPSSVKVLRLSSLERQALEIISPWPVELGGLGWNPKGLPLANRMPPRIWLESDLLDLRPMQGMDEALEQRIDWSQKGRNISLYRKARKEADLASDDLFKKTWSSALGWNRLPLPVRHAPAKDVWQKGRGQIPDLVRRLKSLGLL